MNSELKERLCDLLVSISIWTWSKYYSYLVHIGMDLLLTTVSSVSHSQDKEWRRVLLIYSKDVKKQRGSVTWWNTVVELAVGYESVGLRVPPWKRRIRARFTSYQENMKATWLGHSGSILLSKFLLVKFNKSVN